MKEWEKEAYLYEASSWYSDEDEAWDKTVHHRENGITFTQEQWERFKNIGDNYLFVSAYDEDKEKHCGPLYFEINCNDFFMYACSWGVRIPVDKVDYVLDMLEQGKPRLVDVLACEIEKQPPIMEIVEKMEECGYVPRGATYKYREQHTERGTINDRWQE